MVLADRQPPEDAGFRWLHLDLWDQRTARWIADKSGLPADLQDLFLSTDEQPRILGQKEVLALVLPDFQREFDRDETERIGALHVALAPGLMLTGRHHPLHTPDIFRHRAAQAEQLDPGRALELVLNSLIDTLATRTTGILSEMLALEDQILADEGTPDTRALVAMRRLTARLHRMANGIRFVLSRGTEDRLIAAIHGDLLTRATRRLLPIERDVAAAQQQLRLLREELDLQAGQQTSENVYLLSVITALIMPATLVTGFFGMNTGGMPFEKGAGGTLMATLLAIGCSIATWLLLRTMGLIRR
ncbi:MAG TPA: CorA family divalent cation transporter [Sphingomonas sp.]|nr:CorA family divalent cation transporter [Sphingomonas sp.]